MGELIDIVAEGTPQGPYTIMELMEEDKLNEEEVHDYPDHRTNAQKIQ